MHSGKLKPEDLHEELITKTYDEIADGAKKGYGKDWTKFPADGKGSLPNELKKNIYVFSGAKTYSQLEKLNQYLYDKDGKLRPFNEYSQLAKGINRQYNKNYLQAEWQTARTAAQMAEKWERLQESKAIFPNLKYRSVGDSRVRPEHQKLNGIIKPIDDKFWDRFYPPLDWRCRCDVVATAEDANADRIEDLPTPNFKGNVAKDEEIFTKKGSFFKLLNTNENAVRNAEIFKLNAPLELAYKSKNGKKVLASIFRDKKDYKENFESAVILADTQKIDISIRAHINAEGIKNAEYLINNKLSDLKWNFEKDNYNGIVNAFGSAKKQGLESIVFNFTYKFKNLDIREVTEAVSSKMNKNNGSRYFGLYFIYKKKSVYISREDILTGKLYETLETLKADS